MLSKTMNIFDVNIYLRTRKSGMIMTIPNSFEIAQKQLDECAATLNLDQNILGIIRVPTRELHVSLPVRMDDGTIKVFQGFRVQYNDARGPTKGGIRFHPDETIDTV